MEIKVSVRGLVEFLLRTGDIDNRKKSAPDDAMAEGSRIHRMIQKKMGSSYHAEVMLRYRRDCGEYDLVVEGRADGIIDSDPVAVDEIKGTYRDLSRMKEPNPVHLAQAKCYAWMYGQEHGKERMEVSMTYCNIETEEIRYFKFVYEMSDLEEWFDSLLQEYRKWSDADIAWKKLRQDSIHSLSFPFPYREGQKELVTHVYHTICHSRKLFIEAPTGAGKTISTVFPAVKAVGEGKADRIFYLTAKTIARTVADRTFDLLRERGLHFKTVVLTARDKICFMEESECNPDSCPYAKGHFDRINDAIFELMTTKEHYSREEIEACAQKYKVCPFELGLDMSLFSDGILCDYNYVFDPHVYLRRFFGEGAGREQYLFLIDEAHNLLERGREMYSAPLRKEDLLELKREIKQTITSEMEEAAQKKRDKDGISGQMTLEMTGMSKQLPQEITLEETDGTDSLYVRGHKGKKSDGKSTFVREGYAERISQLLEKCNAQLLSMKRDCDGYRLVDDIDMLVQPLTRLHAVISDYLEEQEKVSLEVRENLLDFYFKLSHFLDIYERQDENYVKYTRLCEDGSFELKLFCVNPRENLKECMLRGRSTILFSATFLPIQYYKNLLGGEKEDYEVYAHSVFDPEKRTILIAGDVTSKFSRRSQEEYYNIARYIHEVVKNRHGNYMIFFPSYSFMNHVYEIYEQYFMTEEEECLVQQESMNEEEREYFLNRFRGNEECDLQSLIGMEIEEEEEQTLIGFCVLGGIFGEGIDLKRDSLIGVIVVGTGLPQVGCEREILKGYFDEDGENGFDYSYRYPGMNKVLQAAGRVIRTAEDVGIIVLLDDRFQQYSYRRLFPREWEQVQPVTVDTVAKKVERFWDAWLWQKG